jgi:hypothetical protein
MNTLESQSPNCQELKSGHVRHSLKTARVSLAQAKLSVLRLKACYSSSRPRRTLDTLALGLDAAMDALAAMPAGRLSGTAGDSEELHALL